MSNTINKAALAEAVRKTSKLRVEDVGGRKERPAETVQSCLNRGYNGLGSDEGLSYILRHAIKYYLSALEPEASPAPLPVGEEEALLALIREEAGKDNSPLGRSDSLAIRRIRTALGLDPHSGAALAKPREQG